MVGVLSLCREVSVFCSPWRLHYSLPTALLVYPSAEMQSAYSAAPTPADWAMVVFVEVRIDNSHESHPRDGCDALTTEMKKHILNEKIKDKTPSSFGSDRLADIAFS